MDKRRQLVDNKKKKQQTIGGMHVVVPLNRNLSLQLFGQLRNLLEVTS
jgi:hypothetical protein